MGLAYTLSLLLIGTQNVPDFDFEQSETMLYHVRLLEERGDLSEALRLLDVNAKSRVIIDRVAVMEIRGM